MIETIKKAFGLKRSIQNPAVPLTSDRVLDYFGIADQKGLAVTPSSALTIAPLWQAVSMVSGDCSKLPYAPYKRRPDLGDRAREIDRAHPAFIPCARAWSPTMPAQRGWRRLFAQALLYNRAYFLIDRKSDPRSYRFYHLLPDRTTWSDAPEHRTEVSPEGMFITEINGDLVPLAASEVFVIEGPHVDGSNECQLVKKARESWAVSLAMARFKSKFFETGTAGGYLIIPPEFSAAAADNLEQGFRKRLSRGLDTSFQAVVLRDGAKFQQATVNPDQMQLNQTSAEQVRQIARWFNLAPGRLGDPAAGHSYGARAEDNRQYHDQTLSHWLVSVQTESWLKLLSEQEKQDDSHTFDHNVRAFFMADPKTQAEVAAIEIQNGCLTPNEYRAATNRNPLPTGGDIISVPMNNYIITDEPLNIYNPAAEAAQETDQETEAAARQVMEADADRARRSMLLAIKKEAGRKKPARFLAWFDGKRAELLETATTAARPSQTVYAAITGQEAAQVTESYRAETASLLDQVDAAANLQPAEMLQQITELCRV